jgi:CDP-glycerol glycerophosphotransferase
LSEPLVSIIIIAYNDAENLPIAIHSALNQSLDSVEVIIVDDASTDSTAEVARKFAQNFGHVTAPHIAREFYAYEMNLDFGGDAKFLDN